MKQKGNSDTIVTKKYLDKTLDKRLEDFEKRFEKKIDEKFVVYEIKMDFKLEKLEVRVDEKARKYRDQILDSNDKLAKTLETMREEIIIGNYQMNEKIKDHEKRIKILESP